MLKKILPWLILSLFAYYLVGTNFGSKLGMIDDHEIAMFLGPDGKINPTEIPSVIMTTEVGQWGNITRYRPSYYTLRVIETAFWRDNAFLWYFSRYLILVVSMLLGWKILSKYFPEIISYLFIFYAFTMPFWPDILNRLGPSEIYALPAVLMFFYGLITNKLWMISLGYLMAVGGKENLLILLPVLLTWMAQKRNSLSKKGWLISISLILYSVFIVIGIVIGTNKSGVDFYLNDISYSKRIMETLSLLPKIISDRHLLVPLILFVILSLYSNIKYAIFGIALLAAAFTQYVFYNNALPTNSRYDFPALLLFPIFDLLIAKMIIEIFKKKMMGKYVKLAIYLGLAAVMCMYVFRRGYTLIHQSSQRNHDQTVAFDTNLQKVIEVAKNDPKAVFVFSSMKFTDYEPIIAVSRYLDASMIKNAYMISYTKEPKMDDILGIELESRLTNGMNGVEQDDQSFKRFLPLKDLSKPCYTIRFYLAPQYSDCPIVASF